MHFLEIYEQNKDKLIAPEGFVFELINEIHSKNIVKWRNDPQMNKFFYDRSKYTLKSQREFLANYVQHDRIDLILVDKENNQYVGVFTLKNLSKHPELGKILGKKAYRGKGLAKKASFYFLQFAFDFFKIDQIFAETKVSNIGNIRLNEKLGFKIVNEKTVNDEKYYVMQITSNELIYE